MKYRPIPSLVEATHPNIRFHIHGLNRHSRNAKTKKRVRFLGSSAGALLSTGLEEIIRSLLWQRFRPNILGMLFLCFYPLLMCLAAFMFDVDFLALRDCILECVAKVHGKVCVCVKPKLGLNFNLLRDPVSGGKHSSCVITSARRSRACFPCPTLTCQRSTSPHRS